MTKTTNKKRSWPTTIIAGILALGFLALSILLLPIHTFAQLSFFVVGLLISILCTLISITGDKGSNFDLSFIITFWQ